MEALVYQTVDLKNVTESVKALMVEHGADTLIGSMMASRGVFILLFSHRHNREFSLCVSSTDLSQVLAKVYETLAGHQ